MDNINPQLAVEQPKEQRGRLPGTKNKFSSESVEKLRRLGFDPIEVMVKLYNDVSKEIEEQNSLKNMPVLLKNGDTRRYSAMAHAQLLTIQQKLVNDLMRYGYARVPETVQVEAKTLPQVSIVLNNKKVIDVTPKRPG